MSNRARRTQTSHAARRHFAGGTSHVARRTCADSGEKPAEELVDHPPIRIDGAQPVAQRRPAIAISGDDVLALDPWTLVEQRDAAARVRPVVEGLQELVPVRTILLPRRVNGIERK